jgi:hypothetical protein
VSRPVVEVNEDPVGDMIVEGVFFSWLRAIGALLETGVGRMKGVLLSQHWT